MQLRHPASHALFAMRAWSHVNGMTLRPIDATTPSTRCEDTPLCCSTMEASLSVGAPIPIRDA